MTPFRTDDFEMVTKPKPVVVKPAIPVTPKPQNDSAKPKAPEQSRQTRAEESRVVILVHTCLSSRSPGHTPGFVIVGKVECRP